MFTAEELQAIDTEYFRMIVIHISELELLTIGTINDMYTEMQNDENQGSYSTLASQDDMDRF